ncbi:MAG: OmpA family protein [Bacteroidales bacterium]
MKIILTGLLVFLGWAAFSSYLYVCKIKDLCNEKETISVSGQIANDSLAAGSQADTLNVQADTMDVQADVIPENLLIYFAFDVSSFEPDSSISAYYEKSMAYLLRNSAAGLHITGHTDAIGSDEYNMALGYRRAHSVKDYFESKGIPSDRITIDSKGEKEPAEDNSTNAGRAKNRRASVTIKN